MAPACTFRRVASFAFRTALLLMAVNFRPSTERIRVASPENASGRARCESSAERGPVPANSWISPAATAWGEAAACSAVRPRFEAPDLRNFISPYAFAANFVEPEETKANRLPPLPGEVFAWPKVPSGRPPVFVDAVLPPTDLVIVLRRLTI